MKFIDSDSNENLLYRKVSENGEIEIGVWPVIFGYRIRAGYVGMSWCEIDYCAGDKLKDIEFTYAAALALLCDNKKFSEFPIQNRKPIYNDPEFEAKLIAATSHLTLEKIDLSQLYEKRTEYLRKTM
jgi:hypothetical protein